MLFTEGAYVPLDAEGPQADHVVAFAREHQGAAALVVAPRRALVLLRGLEAPLVPPDRWRDTALLLPPTLAGRILTDRVTGETVRPGERIAVAEALARFPVALLADLGG